MAIDDVIDTKYLLSNWNTGSVDDNERINARVLGGFLTLAALSVWVPMVASGPWRFFSAFRTLAVPIAAGLAVVGLLVAAVGRYRPLTPSRATWIPVGVVVGQVVMLSHDRWLTAFGPAWSEYTGAHLLMAGFAFAIPLGSALRRRKYVPAAVASGTVVLLSALTLPAPPERADEFGALVGAFLVFGTPALLTGYVFTASDPGGSDRVPGDRTTATEHRR